ncbi:MAG: hypothetical protein IT289_07735 [Oligoflexia bacterium]|nr:hypothetical protein [Oligoflexia bacterium]
MKILLSLVLLFFVLPNRVLAENDVPLPAPPNYEVKNLVVTNKTITTSNGATIHYSYYSVTLQRSSDGAIVNYSHRTIWDQFGTQIHSGGAQSVSIPVLGGEGFLTTVEGTTDQKVSEAFGQLARTEARKFKEPKKVIDSINRVTDAPSLGDLISAGQAQKRLQDSMNEMINWARQREAQMVSELRRRDENARQYLDISSGRAAALSQKSDAEASAQGLELAASLFQIATLNSFDKAKATQAIEALMDSNGEVQIKAHYDNQGFQSQLKYIEGVIQSRQSIKALQLLEEISNPGVTVEGPVSKEKLLEGYVDKFGRALLGGTTYFLKGNFESTPKAQQAQLIRTANLYQAVVIEKRQSLRDVKQSNLLMAGALQLYLAEQHFNAGKVDYGNYALNASKQIALFVGGIISGVGWSLIELAPNVVIANMNTIAGGINSAMQDPNYSARIVVKTIAAMADTLKPELGDLARKYALEITQRPTYQAGLIIGKVITDVAIARYFLQTKAANIYWLIGKGLGNIGQIKTFMDKPDSTINPILNSISSDPLPELLASETEIGKWFREVLNQESKKMENQK